MAPQTILRLQNWKKPNYYQATEYQNRGMHILDLRTCNPFPALLTYNNFQERAENCMILTLPVMYIFLLFPYYLWPNRSHKFKSLLSPNSKDERDGFITSHHLSLLFYTHTQAKATLELIL